MGVPSPSEGEGWGEGVQACHTVEQRAAQTHKCVDSWQMDILSPAYDHLTLGRAALYRAILE